MTLIMRSYRGEEDYWRIRAFLREILLLTGLREKSWMTPRLDYWRWHVNENIEHLRFQDVMFLWETPDGRIAAVLNPEGMGEAFLQLHPALQYPGLHEQMLSVAEGCLASTSPDGRRALRVWTNEQDQECHEILARRGYSKVSGPEYQRQRPLDLPVPEAQPAPGYIVRSLGDQDELPARSYLSWQAFHPDEPDEHYQGWEWYKNVQRAPLYRRDLDLVAVAPSGELAAFCTVWFDDVTRTAMFEPVGTAPAHQRRGLGRAVMCEGLRRAQRLGAVMAYVGSYSPRAGGLYESVGFTDFELCEPWVKEL